VALQFFTAPGANPTIATYYNAGVVAVNLEVVGLGPGQCNVKTLLLQALVQNFLPTFVHLKPV
jgi:hypothetical protein